MGAAVKEAATAGDGVDPGEQRGFTDAAGRQAQSARARTPRRYGLLLVILTASYLLSALFTTKWINDAQIVLFTVAGLISIHDSRLRRRYARVVIAAGFLVSLLVIIIAIHQGGEVGRGVASAWIATLLLLIAATILRQILALSAVTMQSIYGAISTYLIIGLMFAALYSAIYYLHNHMFFANGRPGHTASDFQYFSFTTLTTLGYGDFTAADSGGRAVAMLEAMTGQIFLATLVAKLVASFRPSGQGAR
jgi:Ion channel